MRTTIVSLALAGTLGLAGVAALAPLPAGAQTPSPSTSTSSTPTSTTSAVADRLAALKAALAGLVGDDTITQAQADRVAETLAETPPASGRDGRGQRGGRVSPEATAQVAGVTVEELKTQRQAGRTLAQVAEGAGVSKADLIAGLVTAAEKQLAEDVAAGRLTQTQADEIASGLTARTTEQVDRAGQGKHGRPGGRSGGSREGAPGAAEGSTAPEGSTTPGSAATPAA